MDTLQKLQLLSHGSQYDPACACGTNKTGYFQSNAADNINQR